MSTLFSEFDFKIYPLSEHAVTLTFGSEIAEPTAAKIARFNFLLEANPFPGFTGCVAGYTTLSIFYNLLEVTRSELCGDNGFEKVSHYLKSLSDNSKSDGRNFTPKRIVLPVCYVADYGLDLDEVARNAKLSVDEVIDLHTRQIYKVYMIGFVPGFAYLGGMHERLATARKLVPRATVAAGSVGIAGKQTGIYPLETPGGWQIIGQTPLKMFDSGRSQPSLLKAGDEVQFKSVNFEEFKALEK